MDIYIAEGTQQTGPFDLETIKTGLSTGRYQPTQLAWYEGAPGWEPISKLPGMEAAVTPPPPVPKTSTPPPYSPPPPPAYAPASPSAYPAPPPFVPVPSAPTAPGSSPTPKKGAGACGGAFVGVAAVLVGIFKILLAFVPRHSGGSSYSSTPTPTPSISMTTYFNTADQFTTGERQKYYVNFRFNHPSSWDLVTGSKITNDAVFVELNRIHQKNYVESLVVEDYYTNTASLATDLATIGAKYMANIDANEKNTASYRRISDGPTKLKNYTAYEYRAQLTKKTDSGETFTVYRRYIIVAPPTGSNGVILEMTANSFAPDVHGIDDVGTKDEMAAVLQSFTFL